MWDGIYVISPDVSVEIESNTLIEDGQNALVSMDGGHYSIENAIFNMNLKDVVVKNSSLSYSPGTIRSSVFTSRYITSYANTALNIDVSTLLSTINQHPSV